MDMSETIDLEHRSYLTDFFRRMNLNISDYTFANVYLFRNVSNYKALREDCGLFISAHNRDEQDYVMPLTDLRLCELATLKSLLTGTNFFFPIPEEWLPFFPENEFTITCDEGESDYIYLAQNLASFKGGQYTRHRNHLNQFFSSYEADGRRLDVNNMKDGLAVLQEWQDDSNAALNKTDFEQCREALEKIVELALWGTIYYIENKPAGFIIGEPLNKETFVLHFAKASKQYHGIYEFMFNDTAKRLQSQYRYLNLEEDMGNKNLRRTKGSYGPEMLVKKYHVALKAGRD
jgi:uncharacterized protein